MPTQLPEKHHHIDPTFKQILIDKLTILKAGVKTEIEVNRMPLRIDAIAALDTDEARQHLHLLSALCLADATSMREVEESTSGHLAEWTLNEYLDGVLAAAEQQHVAQHLATCAACRHQLQQLQRLFATLVTTPEVEPLRDFTPTVVAALQPPTAGVRPLLWAALLS